MMHCEECKGRGFCEMSNLHNPRGSYRIAT
jgi:hypothetical protein